MITPSLIYWITRLDAICCACEATAILLGSATAIMLVFGIVARCNEDETVAVPIFRIVRITIPVVVVAILLRVFTPTKKELAAIIVIPKIANSETVEQIGDGVKTLAVEWLEELRPKSKKEQK